MEAPARAPRWGTTVALLTSVLGGASFACAQTSVAPQPAPAVEVFHGAKKVWPLPAPPVTPPPKPVVPAEYKGGPVAEEPGRTSAAFVPCAPPCGTGASPSRTPPSR
ncbi:MAG TPA: hypothetical protein VMZ71_08035 [Gemmataceae bacterium]|nr:hypothetical protein [Gemmataceae bacterium]